MNLDELSEIEARVTVARETWSDDLFITLGRTDIPKLLAEVKKLKEQVESMREMVEIVAASECLCGQLVEYEGGHNGMCAKGQALGMLSRLVKNK